MLGKEMSWFLQGCDAGLRFCYDRIDVLGWTTGVLLGYVPTDMPGWGILAPSSLCTGFEWEGRSLTLGNLDRANAEVFMPIAAPR